MLDKLLPLLRYFAQAQTRYRVHSPFVADWLAAVLEDRRWYYAFDDLDRVGNSLLLDRREISVTDLGAGPRSGRSANVRRISEIARTAVCTPAKGRFLFRQALFSKPQTVLELGTSLGISSLYLRAAAPKARLITVEGCPQTAAFARGVYQKVGGTPPDLRVGAFDELLPGLLAELGHIDLLYLDGNHREAPTLRYFEQCLPFAAPDSVFLLDDIYWSAEMRNAWAQLAAHPSVTLSIDVFHTGLLFFRDEQREKQHFVLAPWHWKPYQAGFFRSAT